LNDPAKANRLLGLEEWLDVRPERRDLERDRDEWVKTSECGSSGAQITATGMECQWLIGQVRDIDVNL
jgi:hypothetical protein